MKQMKRICVYSLIGAFLFSIFTVIGSIYAPYGEKVGGIENTVQIFAYIPITILLMIMYYFLINKLFQCSYHFCYVKKKSKIQTFYDEHIFLVAMVLIILSWIPYVICFFPGSVSLDGYWQLDQFLGLKDLSNHHPIFTTFLYGILFKMGKIVNDNMGVFFCIIFQIVLCSSVYAYMIKKIREMGTSIYGCMFVNLFFMIIPVWGMFAQAIVKDTIFVAVFVLSFICFLEMEDIVLKKRRGPMYFKILEWFLIYVLLCIIRQNGKYLILPTLFIFTIFTIRYTKKILLLFCMVVVFLTSYDKILVPMTGAKEASIREMYSVPFQQTARYFYIYSDEVTTEEYDAVDAVLDADMLKKAYNPIYADPVKGTFKKDATKEQIKDYLKTWFQMFWKHPKVYIEAFLQHSYGYLDPFHLECPMNNYINYIANKSKVATGDLDIYYVQEKAVREGIKKYANSWLEVFPFVLVMYPGTYTWIVIFCILLLCKKGKWKQLSIMLIPVISILICMASPVNSYIRYALPVMGITPLLIIWTCKESQN